MTGPARTGRRPGNPDTRRQILDSARKVFAGHGFAKASIRRIAAGAGVDPALVHHYFGSKDELFLATVQLPVDPRAVVDQLVLDGPDGLGTRMIGAILQVWESPAGASLIAAIRTAIGDPTTTRALGEFITAEIVTRLLHSLNCPPSEVHLRTGLVISQVLGVVVGRYVLALEALTQLGTAEIAAAVGPTLQAYLTGTLAGAQLSPGEGEPRAGRRPRPAVGRNPSAVHPPVDTRP
ncbi:regulatory protein, tetR family [Nakamurella panacisegetis]|uniref:Regulatory protein, tetR family n=1 Tax=Nakamurella panacisegetis TaxID=1090615 RepID=A0A1H0MMI8_9ACTN|nr:TetR family transcriptional regulator [Nakamurella panacisegetis]SDO81669.1 regulatory protein, tetR family [Nakamurella panacisegetis]